MIRYLALLLLAFPLFISAQSNSILRQNAQKLEKDGNFKEALKIYEKLISTDTADFALSKTDLDSAVNCQSRLNQREDFDGLIETFLKVRSDDWQAYATAGFFFIHKTQHNGRLVNGKFKRGYNGRYRGVYVYSTEYDRTMAMSLYEKALSLLPADYKGISLYSEFAQTISWNRSHQQAYLLQELTDTKTLPDLSQPQYHGYYRRSNSKAPVDDEGNPLFYSVPDSYSQADNDGERWRWLLAKCTENGSKTYEKWVYAEFLYSQFSVETLREYSWYFRNEDQDNKSSILALDKLKDSETIAKLAGGIKKFTMPEEHSFMALYKHLAEAKNISALYKLGTIYLNRRQYKKSVDIWNRVLEISPNNSHAKHQLKQITGNWGEFVSVTQSVHGKNPHFDFRFRNAEKVKFRATKINIRKLIDDTIAYINTKPDKLGWNKLNFHNIGYQILKENQQNYLTAEIELWEEKLNPAAGYFNRRVSLEGKFSNSGTWLLESEIENGNKSHTLVDIASTMIVQNRANEKTHYYIANAETGKALVNS
ncbi:MAG: tetratricopeptide repeat protein, partial [Lentisphaeraceae bacterium]|nr:tetratricopeptide repeat protein [Lentisphaeraceae bacterium]